MSKPLLAVIGSVIVLGFVYMHFEWFPAHTGPDRATAQTQIAEWARATSGQTAPDVRISRVNVPDAAGVASAEVTLNNFYFELDGNGQHYTGRGRVEFERAGPLFRPAWTISSVTLLDREPNVPLRASHRR